MSFFMGFCLCKMSIVEASHPRRGERDFPHKNTHEQENDLNRIERQHGRTYGFDPELAAADCGKKTGADRRCRQADHEGGKLDHTPDGARRRHQFRRQANFKKAIVIPSSRAISRVHHAVRGQALMRAARMVRSVFSADRLASADWTAAMKPSIWS
ncbi:hypothetical protein [Martelella sp. AD-3]|uniref:hypothetical protein n=1 Tax=Martelella sp. AD-3 TaxID=686597 RepID=UPI0013777556|nr:hypothetical protein [Martelella sp. AD-3]